MAMKKKDIDMKARKVYINKRLVFKGSLPKIKPIEAYTDQWVFDEWLKLGIMANKLIFADIAQLAERLTCNQQVNGSSPFIGFLVYAAQLNMEISIKKYFSTGGFPSG